MFGYNEFDEKIKQIHTLYGFLKTYQSQLIGERDPAEQFKLEENIKSTKEKIEKRKPELWKLLQKELDEFKKVAKILAPILNRIDLMIKTKHDDDPLFIRGLLNISKQIFQQVYYQKELYKSITYILDNHKSIEWKINKDLYKSHPNFLDNAIKIFKQTLLEHDKQQQNNYQEQSGQYKTPLNQKEDISKHLSSSFNKIDEGLNPYENNKQQEKTDNIEKSQLPSGNYRKLRELLEYKNWKEADQETIRIILEVAKREKESFLRTQDIKIFPCSDLQIIDKLWLKYSNNQFGLSVQKNIWHNISGNVDEFHANLFNKLGDRLGWYETNKWLDYDNLIFTLESPEGHLPSLRLSEKSRKGSYTDLRIIFRGFLSRIATCLLE